MLLEQQFRNINVIVSVPTSVRDAYTRTLLVLLFPAQITQHASGYLIFTTVSTIQQKRLPGIEALPRRIIRHNIRIAPLQQKCKIEHDILLFLILPTRLYLLSLYHHIC